jgi:hypothetical protein
MIILLIMTRRCKSCDAILIWELVLSDRLATKFDVCISCISAAVNEILKEEKQAVYRRINAAAEAKAAAAAEQVKE